MLIVFGACSFEFFLLESVGLCEKMFFLLLWPVDRLKWVVLLVVFLVLAVILDLDNHWCESSVRSLCRLYLFMLTYLK